MTTQTISLGRTARLARWNAALLIRNKAAFTYAAVLPLLPLALLFGGDRGDPVIGASAITTTFLVAALFPVYYNVLSQFVSRRDELVLKRMRTGETKDNELLASIALPGMICAVVICAIAIPAAVAFGQPMPVNLPIYVIAAVVSVIMFSAFAYWTAGWTRSAEAAQLTSMPIIFLAFIGPLAVSVPDASDTFRNVLAATPGGAIAELIRSAWFGLEGVDAKEATLSFAETWSAAADPLLVLAVWTVVAVSLAKRSMRWEPRA